MNVRKFSFVFGMVVRKNCDHVPICNELTGFITEKERVYCAVRTESLYINEVSFIFKMLIIDS